MDVKLLPFKNDILKAIDIELLFICIVLEMFTLSKVIRKIVKNKESVEFNFL